MPIAVTSEHAERASIIVLAHRSTQHLSDCIASIHAAGATIPYEIVVLLNAVQRDEALRLPAWEQTRVVRSPLNLGFSAGNNVAATFASGDYLIFLNDDTVVEPGWLDALVRTAQMRPEAGAIGSCITFPDGSLQEAGSVIWSDGTTAPLGRGERLVNGSYNTVATVDFCSANGLLVRRSAWQRAGGFNEDFYPAYYEDVDLCLTLRHQFDFEILYEPRSRVRHIEAASSVPAFRAFLFARNVKQLRKRWTQTLASYPAFTASSPLPSLSRRIREARLRILLIDDRIPNAALGSGFGRFENFFVQARERNYAVSLLPTADASGDLTLLQDNGANLIEQPLERWMATAGGCDAVIISRPHNYERFATRMRRMLPGAAFIYDAEALFHRRLFQALELGEGENSEIAARRAANQMLALERRIARECTDIVCISREEYAILQQFGAKRIHLQLPLAAGIVFGERPFEERSGVIFVAGWLAGNESPNVPSLRWFLRKVWPHVKAALPRVQLRVSGANPPQSVLDLADDDIRFEGFVERLDRFYDSARVVVSPMLYGAGTKVKTIEALQYGVPVVATAHGAEGFGAQDRYAISIADDAKKFAGEVVRLLQDAEHWNARRREMQELLQRLRAES
ncbi:MAG: glycosyltransferase, partial [Candidatus Eremiobacteraeota bacterium]|nr:glycosyltransferase [Candidatus Eremiobacteraeota bacterium]